MSKSNLAETFAKVANVAVMIGTPFALAFGYVISLDDSAESLGLTNALADYLVGLAWALVLLASIYVWPVSSQHRFILMVLWVARIGTTLGLMLFYEGYYPLDAAFYFTEGLIERDPWSLFGFGTGTDNMVAFAAIHNQILPASYHATKVTFSMFGLVAIYLIYRAACLYFRRDFPPLLYLVGLFPSIMFWSSIMGKDPLTLLGIAIYCYAVVGYAMKGGLRFIAWATLGILLAASMRIWLAMIFVLPLGVVLLFGRIGPIAKALLVLATVAGGILAVQLFMEKFDIEMTEDIVATADIFSEALVGGGSEQTISGGFTDIGSILAFLPWAAFSTLFRPLPGEVTNLFGFVAGLENVLLLSLVIRALFAGHLRRLSEPLVAWIVVTIVVWAASYGILSYQNLGTAFRYKLQVMPLLLLLLLYLGAHPRLQWQKETTVRSVEFSKR